MKQATIEFKSGNKVVVIIPDYQHTYDYIRDHYDLNYIERINDLKVML